MLKLLFEDAIR